MIFGSTLASPDEERRTGPKAKICGARGAKFRETRTTEIELVGAVLERKDAH